jgi:hypothetical protein
MRWTTTLAVAAALACAVAAPARPLAADGKVYVEMNSDDPKTTLFRVVDGAQGSLAVCIPPCQKYVDPGFVYNVGGDGIRRSSSFVFPSNQERVRLDVKTGSSALFATGVVLSIGGGILALNSLGFFAIASIAHDSSAPGESDPSSGFRKAGFIILGTGAVAIVGGLALAFSNGTSVRTTYGTVVGQTPRRKPPRVRLSARGLEF